MQLEKNNNSSQAITASPPGHDSIHPSTDFSEKTLSENDPADDDQADHDPADNEPVNTDPEQAQPPARIEVEPPPDGGYGWVCVMCVFLVNAHTWGINSVGSRGLQTMLDLLIFVAISHMVYFWHIIWTQIHFRGHQT